MVSMMAEQAKNGMMAKNARGPGRGKAGVPAAPAFKPTLASQKIDKNLAKRARKMAAIGARARNRSSLRYHQYL